MEYFTIFLLTFRTVGVTKRAFCIICKFITKVIECLPVKVAGKSEGLSIEFGSSIFQKYIVQVIF